jgi:hypothetical protein
MSERRRRLDKAAKNAQIARNRQNLPFRFDIDDFGFGRERAPHGAMLFHPHNQSMNPFGGRPPRQIGASVSFFTWMPLSGLPRLFRSFPRFNAEAYSKPPFSIKRWADWSRTLAAPILVRRKPSHNMKKEKPCDGMEGLIEEGSNLIEEDLEGEVKDAGLIAAAQRVEHYEMAAYGTVRTYANILGDKKAALLLQETLDEEKQTDHNLTTLAESINVKAAAARASH